MPRPLLHRRPGRNHRADVLYGLAVHLRASLLDDALGLAVRRDEPGEHEDVDEPCLRAIDDDRDHLLLGRPLFVAEERVERVTCDIRGVRPMKSHGNFPAETRLHVARIRLVANERL